MAGVAVALAVIPAGPASAHVGGGPEPSNYAAVITSVSRVVPGLDVSLSADGERLRVTNGGAGELLVPGYSDEPYLRIEANGVQRNTRSPATYLNVSLSGDTELPPEADPSAAPEWTSVSDTPTYEWHDHRTHWMGSQLPPAVQADPTAEHLIASWEVPLVYDGQPMLVAGTLTWYPPPSSLPSTVLGVGLIVVGLAVAGRARWQRPLVVLLGLAVVAEAGHLATSPVPAESPVYAVTAAALPTVVAALLTWASWRSVRAGTSTVVYLAGIAGWLVLLQGLSDVSVLWNSQVPSAGPDWLTRLVVAVSVGLGLGVVLGAGRLPLRGRARTPVTA
ncbi:hypothetical protein BH18ACT7_BH18ACT7_02120 [soil metagenome]